MAQSTLSESQSSAELIIQNREQGPITTDGQLGKEGMMNGTLTLSNHLAQRAPFLKTLSVCLHESRVLEQFYLTFFFSSLRMCFSTTSTNEVPAKRDHVQSTKMFRFQCTFTCFVRERVSAISDPTTPYKL